MFLSKLVQFQLPPLCWVSSNGKSVCSEGQKILGSIPSLVICRSSKDGLCNGLKIRGFPIVTGGRHYGSIVYGRLGCNPLKVMNLVRPQIELLKIWDFRIRWLVHRPFTAENRDRHPEVLLKYTRLTQLVQSDASTKRKS